MKNRLPKRLSAWLLTLVMLVGMLPATASADEVGEDLAPPAPQDYGYVRLVFSEGEQLDLHHGEYITERSPTAEVFGNASEDFIANGEYAALYYEGKLYHKAALDGVSIDADAVLPAEDFALVPMGEAPTTLSEEREDETPPAVEVVEPEDESSGTGETVGTPPSTEPVPPALPESKEEDKTTEDEGDPSGSDYDIEADTQPQGSMRMPVMPTATGNYPGASSVFVDGDKQFYDPGSLYYINGDQSKRFTGDANNYNAAYDPTTGTLTLKNYSGKGISVGGVNRSDITVVLKGTNIIKDGSLENAVGGNITITSSNGGTLSITRTLSGGNPAIGIEAGFGASYKTGNVTIEGSAKVKISTTHGGTGDKEKAYGIFAKENITISGDASVDITCATPNSTYRLGDYCNGLRADKNVTINTNGTIKINVKTAGKEENNGYSYGVYPMSGATLTKVGNMEVQWRKNGSSGGAFFRGGSFNTSTHAVNVDTTNCYASYRKGTPYQVTAGNGTLTGPGVPNKMGSGMFLKGDTVNITPNIKTGKSGEVIPFQKWTSDDVTFDKSATTADNSFTVPAKKVTVIAEHSPFDGKPTFTPTGDLNDRGLLTFNTVVNPYDGNEYFALVKVGEEGSYNAIRPDTSSQTKPYVYTYEATSRHSSSYVAPGEYYVAEYLNGWWYLSEKFTVNYVKPHPEISVSYWPDPTDFGSVNVGYTYTTGRNLTIDNKGEAATGELTITVEGKNPDAFTVSKKVINNIPVGGSATSTVRPAMGLPAGIYTATLKISGANVNTLSINVKFTVKDPNASATVSGTAVSWNATDDAQYYLYPSTMTDADIRAQWKKGGTVSGYYTEYTVTKETISSTTVDGKAMKAQTFSFDTVPAGDYKLVIFKPEKYVPKIVPITVESTALDLGQLKLWLYGDVNYDGVVDSADVLQMNRYTTYKTSIFGKGDAQEQAERFEAGNITAIKNTDTIIDGSDVLQVNRYIAGKSSMFDAVE